MADLAFETLHVFWHLVLNVSEGKGQIGCKIVEVIDDFFVLLAHHSCVLAALKEPQQSSQDVDLLSFLADFHVDAICILLERDELLNPYDEAGQFLDGLAQPFLQLPSSFLDELHVQLADVLDEPPLSIQQFLPQSAHIHRVNEDISPL